MRISLYWGPGVGPCVLAACCVLSLGRVTANDRSPSGSCPCGREPVVQLGAASPLPPPGIGPASVLMAPLPPVTPPPGTLGWTYQRQSWLTPANRHPRIAMLDVRAPAGATDVRVLTTYEYREDDEIEGFQDPDDPCVWHFESRPLIPGIPHIYKVVATGSGPDAVQFVRLIRGRRVTLEF